LLQLQMLGVFVRRQRMLPILGPWTHIGAIMWNKSIQLETYFCTWIGTTIFSIQIWFRDR
jgi:hypothetical protein